MPVAAVVGEKIFCTHGGLSPELDSLRRIIEIQRPTEVRVVVSRACSVETLTTVYAPLQSTEIGFCGRRLQLK